jgi:TRAP transporter 4TM/12TM fusion protein
MDKEQEISRTRSLKGIWLILFLSVSAITLVVDIIHVFNILLAGTAILEQAILGIVLALLLPWAFLLYPATDRSPRDRVPWHDYIFALFGFVCPLFVFIVADQLTYAAWDINPPAIAIVLGMILWFLVLEAGRRVTGLMFAVMVAVFSIYPLFCQFMPGFLLGKGYSFTRVVAFHYLSLDSIFGIPMNVFINLLIGFMVFAGALQVTGGGKFFINIALSLLGHFRGGPAKVSIVASGLFGMVSGSGVANVLSIGPVTIPAMIKAGYPPDRSAATASCAALGGILMPPVMGTTAFIMADFLGVPYISVAAAAALPAFLYYLSLFLQTDFYAAKMGLKGIPKEELPSLRQTLKEGWIYILAFFVLIYMLAWLRIEGWAPFFAAGALLFCSMFRKETRVTPKAFIQFIGSIGRVLTELAAILAPVGMLIGSLTLTGVGHSFSREIIGIAGQNVLLMLFLGALGSGLLGTGMTITACYVFLAVCLAPALTKIGVYPMAAHLFIFYWGMMSDITPPTAISVCAAASIAKAPAMKSMMRAMTLGIILYIVPFFFAINPALLLKGSPLFILQSLGVVALGIIVLSGGLEGYFYWVGKISGPARISLILSGTAIAYPEWISTVVGAVVAALTIGILLILKRKRLIRSPSPPK